MMMMMIMIMWVKLKRVGKGRGDKGKNFKNKYIIKQVKSDRGLMLGNSVTEIKSLFYNIKIKLNDFYKQNYNNFK